MKRVYIVDDSQKIRERLIRLLADDRAVAVVGNSPTAEDATGKMDVDSIDALVLDVALPGKSGIELLREVKQLRPEMQVIIMTNYDYPEYRRQSMMAGADLFFNKTKDFEALIEALKKT